MLLANSLIEGFTRSNFIGQGIVYVQILCSIVMFAAIFGKWKQISGYNLSIRRFSRDFSTSQTAVEYYVQRRPKSGAGGIVGIYVQTVERLLKLLGPAARALVLGVGPGAEAPASPLSPHEIDLIGGTCEYAVEEEVLRIGHGMTIITTIVALEPLLGLLGTVWGVLDAFAEMGTAGSANLATIAPSISSALVTTVVGLLVAIPGMLCANGLNSSIRRLTADLDGFGDELMARIKCEFQNGAN